GGAVAGHQAKLGEHVGINAEGGGVRSALARVVDVDAVERVVPGAVARAVHVNAAAGVGAVDDAGLRIDEVQRITPARGDDRQIHHLLGRDRVAVVARAARLHDFGPRGYFDCFGERAHFEPGVDGRRLPDRDAIARGDKAAETLGFDLHGVVARLHGFEDVRASAGRRRGEGHAGGFIGELYGCARDGCAARVFDETEYTRSGALSEDRRAEKKQRSDTNQQTLKSHCPDSNRIQVHGATTAPIILCTVRETEQVMPLRFFAAVFAASALHAQAPSATEIRTSISRALPVVQRATTEFYKSQDCHSCHHLSLPLLTYAVARERGVAVDEEAARAIAAKGLAKVPDITAFDRAVQDNMIIDTVVSDGWALIAANAAGIPRTAVTGVYARRLANAQRADGHFRTIDNRPPQSFGDFVATTIAVRAIALDMPEQLADEK